MGVELLIEDLGGAIPRFFVKLRILYMRRSPETPVRRKGVQGEGNNPD